MNVDKLKLFPNQLIDGDPTECVGLTIADIASNIDGIVYDPDFAYASSFRLQGIDPSDGGTDPWADIQAACFYGMLPTSLADFSAKTVGELRAANWKNYSPADIAEALKHTQKPPMSLGVDYGAVKNYLDTVGWGVSIPMRWYADFTSAPGGILTNSTANYTSHNVACYGYDERGLIIKPWLGTGLGDGGYFYMPIDVFNRVVTASYAFNPNGLRWVAIIGMLITRFPALASNTMSLLQANQGIMPPLAQSIYDVTKASLGKHLTLDPSVPFEVGCAEAVSTILSKAGVKGVPQHGFAGTDDLDQWLSTNKQFTRVVMPTVGGIVVSPTQGTNHGHTGITAIHGYCSNDSSNGLFSENYNQGSWEHYFTELKGLETHYYACA